MNGLGAEVAKNVILANAKQVGLHDRQTVSWMDLGAHFYLSEEVPASGLDQLNPGAGPRSEPLGCLPEAAARTQPEHRGQRDGRRAG